MAKRKPAAARTEETGRFAYQGLERSIHEKARLGIMTSLLAHPKGVTFNDLKRLCELTDGNLSRHLEVLQAEGLVTLVKQPDLGRPVTLCQMTSAGRKKFLDYLEELQRVISDAAILARPSLSAGFRWSREP